LIQGPPAGGFIFLRLTVTTPNENAVAIVRNEEKLSAHEKVCAERYDGIAKSFARGEKRMRRIEYIIYALIVAVLAGPGFAAKFIEGFLK
jgi:hypothetical protein